MCARQASVTAGTIFHRSRTPLQTWFAAAWLMTSQKQGISALGLQRALGFGSYQTAWAMLHRFRVAMVRPGRDRLAGHVEVDEAYVGGVEPNVGGRETVTKSIVAIAVEIENPKGFGRIRLQHVADVSKESLIGFVEGAVEPGATVHTDGWQAYWTLSEHGYTHERTVMRAQSEPAHVVMPGVHRVASLLQRWLLGTHQGRVSPEHLDAYLNEFTFRFNRRNSRRRGLLFYRLLSQAVATDPITYHAIVANPSPTGRQSTLPPHPGRSRRRASRRSSVAPTRSCSNLTQMDIPSAAKQRPLPPQAGWLPSRPSCLHACRGLAKRLTRRASRAKQDKRRVRADSLAAERWS
jgi:transposase-like protein